MTTGQLLDVVRGRSADDVARWLAQGPPSWRQRIEAVAIDPHAGYLKGICPSSLTLPSPWTTSTR